MRTGASFHGGEGGGGFTDAAPEAALASVLSVRYPFALDVAPALVEGVTPLSAQWDNYLGLMVEAVQAEIGPIGSLTGLIGGVSASLMDFLGTEVAARISVVKGNDAGRIFGLHHVRTAVAGTNYGAATPNSLTITKTHGQQPSGVVAPLVFGCPQGDVLGSLPTTGPWVPRGNAVIDNGANWTMYYRGCRGDAFAGLCTGATVYTVDWMLFYMLT